MGMEIETKIDELVLALMTQNKFDDIHAWKSFDESLERLQQKKYIRAIPNAKSVLFTPEGLVQAEALFKKHISNNG